MRTLVFSRFPAEKLTRCWLTASFVQPAELENFLAQLVNFQTMK